MPSSKLRRYLGIVRDIPRLLLRSLVHDPRNVPAVGRRMLRALRHRYLPAEAFEIGLLDPTVPLDAAERTISRSEMVSLQRRLNPMDWEWVLADKGIFYRIAQASGLPVPAMYGLFFREGLGWTAGGKGPALIGEWEEFFLLDCPAQFVVKPTRGVYGSGIRVVLRKEGRFLLHDGSTWDVNGFVRSLLEDPDYAAFVIQEQIHNHEALALLGTGGGVHSLRLVTLAEPGKAARVVAADMKVIVGKNVASNLAHGRPGNLIAEIGLEDGRVRNPIAIDLKRGGYRHVSLHPDTGVDLAGFRIPEWSRIAELAVRAASVFLPIRTVGWDIALTENGPCILEGNVWYDPSLQGVHPDYWAVRYLRGSGTE
jgi:hypothetical protein